MRINNMNADFHSEKYQKINWANSLKKCYEKKSNECPRVLASYRWALLPIHYIQFEKIHFQFPSRMLLVNTRELTLTNDYFLDESGIKVANFPIGFLNDYQSSEENNYFKLCEDVCYEALSATKMIFSYTCDHLSLRISEKIRLIDHESVQLLISRVLCHLQSAEVLLNTFHEISTLCESIYFMLIALELLTELGGGRVMLCGNAVELLFHLRLFQSLFLFQ